jgi:two-component system nitrate/nitrite response regulator NarL
VSLAPAEAMLASRDPAPLRLLVVSEAGFIGEALAAALKRDSSVATVTCANAAETLALRSTVHADAILVDAAHQDDTSAVRRLREIAPHLPIIACAVKETDEDVVRWAEAGVTGYLPRTIKLTQIVPLVTDILGGEQICSGRAAAALFRRVASTARLGASIDAPSPARGLTRRERQVAELVASGLGDKQIARQLSISLATAKTHVHNLLGKLNLMQRGEVAAVLYGRIPSPAGLNRIGIRPELVVTTSGLFDTVC